MLTLLRKPFVWPVVAFVVLLAVVYAVGRMINRSPIASSAVHATATCTREEPGNLPAISAALGVMTDGQAIGPNDQVFLIGVNVVQSKSMIGDGILTVVVLDRATYKAASLWSGPSGVAGSISLQPPPAGWLRDLGPDQGDSLQDRAVRLDSVQESPTNVLAAFKGDPAVSKTDITIGILYFGPSHRFWWATQQNCT